MTTHVAGLAPKSLLDFQITPMKVKK